LNANKSLKRYSTRLVSSKNVTKFEFKLLVRTYVVQISKTANDHKSNKGSWVLQC